MGRTKRIILLTILFLCVFSILFVYKFITENSISDNSIYDNAEFTSKYNNDLKNCGWIPNWASKDGLASLKSNSNILDCISPVLYEVKDNGSLNNISPANLNEIISYAKSKNIKIYPTITLFDYQIFTKVLQNTENYQRHIDELLAVANNPAFDGIDLDYESTQYSDNDQYKKFVIELSSKLHEKSKKLIITVLSKWGDDVVYASLPETRHVQDWRFLSDYADYIRIMA